MLVTQYKQRGWNTPGSLTSPNDPKQMHWKGEIKAGWALCWYFVLTTVTKDQTKKA